MRYLNNYKSIIFGSNEDIPLRPLKNAVSMSYIMVVLKLSRLDMEAQLGFRWRLEDRLNTWLGG